MLEGDVKVRQDLFFRCNGVDQLISELVGIHIVQTNPVEVHLAQLPQQLRQTAGAVQVHAVSGDVLGDDDQLLHPILRQGVGFLQNVLRRTAPVLAPQLGDDAEGTVVAAPLGDLQVGQVIRGGQQPLTALVGMVDVPVKFRASGRP